MGKKTFTPEEIAILRNNPYIKNAGANKIYYKAAFKQEFWERYQYGETTKEIIASMGIDPEILGNARIRGILKHIKEEAASGIGFTEGQHRFDKNAPAKELQPISRRVVLLEHEIAYIKQELEFIKKIILADREAMRKCSSKRERTSSSESSEK